MDTRNYNIHRTENADEFRRLEEREKELGGRLMPVPDEDLKRLEAGDKPMRKNWMRNQPCVCGSGRKFKKCCWSSIKRAEGHRP